MQIKKFLNSLLKYNPSSTSYPFEILEKDINEKSVKDISNFKKETIYSSMPINLDYMKSKYNLLINSDIVLREFTLNARGKQYHAFVMYIDGMVSSEIMDNFVLKPLMLKNKANSFDGNESIIVKEALTNNISIKKVKKFSLDSYIMNCLMPQNSVKMEHTFENIILGINSRKLWLIY